MSKRTNCQIKRVFTREKEAGQENFSCRIADDSGDGPSLFSYNLSRCSFHRVVQVFSPERIDLMSLAPPLSSLRPEEINHFSRFSQTWWDEKGPFSVLHQLNPIRLRFIHDQMRGHFQHLSTSSTPFQNLRFLDVGCGGGLLTEPLCRLGGEVVGIDATASNIEIAQAHGKEEGLPLQYHVATVEDFQDKGHGFDVVTALEIVEHVQDPFAFIQSCSKQVKPGGMLFLSTLNRTFWSYALGIVAAEYLLGWVPQGTHHWEQFVKPEEMEWFLRKSGIDTLHFRGLTFQPLTGQWALSDNTSINYFVSGVKIAGHDSL